MKEQRMEAGSAHRGALPKGCQQCLRGSKLVLLVTGVCSTGCYYCPLSESKKGRDVVYANERRVIHDLDVVEEARLIDAEGTGVTGGDPLARSDRTLHFISLMKKEFGDAHHIHLYTSTIHLPSFKRLEMAGLDELRLHPEDLRLDVEEMATLRALMEDTQMAVGIEIPAIPGEEERIRELIRQAEKLKMAFVNLNELEFSETNWRALRGRGFDVKDDVSSAVLGSEEMALALIDEEVKIPLHYCSSSFKDRVQLRRRILRRAENVALPLDIITEEGMLLKGVIETEAPEEAILLLMRDHGVPSDLIRLDTERGRLEVASWVLEEIAKDLPYDCFLVEEYPTADRLEVEREPLRRR